MSVFHRKLTRYFGINLRETKGSNEFLNFQPLITREKGGFFFKALS